VSSRAVLCTTYPEAFLHKGGGEYEMLETAFNLRKMGLISDVYSPFSRDVEAYDIIIHFSLEAGGLPLLEQARNLERTIILWPNFWLSEELSPDRRVLFKHFFNLSDAVVFKSRTEQGMLSGFVPENCRILSVPAGVDPCFAESTPERLFRNSYELENYILWVGIIEPGKNQLGVIKALRDIDLPVVFIGNYRDRRYYELCREAAPDHFLFLDPMPHKSDILRAALRECRLYIEPTRDAGGKSVLEAAISGADVLLADSEWAREHFGEFPLYVNPDSAQSILEGVRLGLRRKADPAQAVRLAARHTLPEALRPLYDFIAGGR
jgi:glycosyltransferase involved in cell wall biosynthesis